MKRRVIAAVGIVIVAVLALATPASAGAGDDTDQGGGGGGGNAGDAFLVWSLAYASHQSGSANPIPCQIEQDVIGPDGEPVLNDDGTVQTEIVQGHITYSPTLNSQEFLLGLTGEQREGIFIRVECNGPGIVDDDINTLLSVPFIVAVDELDLLDVSLERMGIPEPPINTSPGAGQPQLVNLETWLWLDPGYWITRTATASATVDTGVAPVTITATLTARPTHVRWDMGDGRSVTCEGPGTAYDQGAPASSQSTDCGYTYRRSSAAQASNAYSMTATVTWTGDYTVSVGGGGSLGTLDVTSEPVPVRVAESQALVD